MIGNCVRDYVNMNSVFIDLFLPSLTTAQSSVNAEFCSLFAHCYLLLRPLNGNIWSSLAF